jgi:hypothetical protein
MPRLTIYHHDPVEVDPRTSWTGLVPRLAHAVMPDIRSCKDPAVQALFEYARPDAVVVLDGAPVVAIEQTQMNPSGHNIPQRFSCMVRAAELGVPSILYYPQFSRRTFSDPNVRYLQVRVPIAQFRLTGLYSVPSLSVFWPTDSSTLLPSMAQAAHQEMANVVDALVDAKDSGQDPLRSAVVTRVFNRMKAAVMEKMQNQKESPSVRTHLPSGYATVRDLGYPGIDPPTKAELIRTSDLVAELEADYRQEPSWPATRQHLMQRQLTLRFTGTTNKSGTDSEHPWPGYLTLIDVLYARSNGGRRTTQRDQNLVYSLPAPARSFLQRLAREDRPTAAHIVDVFSDLLILNGGAVAGRPARGGASPVLALRAR